MLRPFCLLVASVLIVGLRAEPEPLLQPLVSPAAAGSSAPQLVTATDGTVWMSWVETLGEDGHRLMCASFDAARTTWNAPREIARGRDWFVNWADTPQLAAGADGRLAAVWFVNNPSHEHDHHGSYRAWTGFSDDGGATWTSPVPLSQESQYNEFVSIVALPEDRWLAIWLDGRGKHVHPASDEMRLYGRVLGRDGPDELLDERVCDCCATTLALLPDGSAYAVYRDRSGTEVRDLSARRWRDGRWSGANGLPADGWQINGCPVNGPVLSRGGAGLGLVWFTAENNQPRVQATVSTDAGERWLMPQRLDRETMPLGRVGAVLLRDGSLWASWLESTGSVALARLAPNLEPGPVHRIAGSPKQAGRAGGIPRLALVADASGPSAKFLLARTETEGSDQPPRISTHLITLAARADEAGEDCNCPRKPSQEGHPVRGKIVRLLPERESVLMAHEEVPGVMKAMTMAFRVEPQLLQHLKPEQEVVGRMARRDDGRWWLFDVRIVKRAEQ
jgi:Cu/Ag efflux protein CusF